MLSLSIILEGINEMLDFMAEYLRSTIIDITNSLFGGNIIWLALTISSMVYIANKRRTLAKGAKLYVIFTLLILLAIIYNPVFRYFFIRIPDSGDAVLNRLWLLCPLWMIVAYAFTDFKMSFKKKTSQVLVAVGLFLLLSFSGYSIFTHNMYNNTECIYKIRKESVEISDIVLANGEDQPKMLLIVNYETWEEARFENGGTIIEGIMMYTGDICILRQQPSEAEWNDYWVSEYTPQGRITGDYINSWLKAEYIAVPNDERIIPNLEFCGYELIGKTEDYFVFSKS